MFPRRKKITTFVNEFKMHTMDWGWILNNVFGKVFNYCG
jgi:hypothetical protein